MKLKQKFLKQSIIIVVSTIIITSCLGFVYTYFYNLLSKSNLTDGIGQMATIILENDTIVYSGEDFTKLQVKEMLMNLSVENNYFEYKKNKYKIYTQNFTTGEGKNYKIITLNQVINPGHYYNSLFIFVSSIFIIVFIIASLIVRRENTKNIIIPIIDLTRATNKLKDGDLETAITDRGYGEIKDLSAAIEGLRLRLKNSIYYQKKVDENRKFLISSISHDLKTPVTSIRGYIDGVLDGVANTDEKKDYYLSKAIEKTKLIDIIIEDLLLYSKLDLDQISFEEENIDIVEYIKDCMEDNLESFATENKTISFESNLIREHLVILDTIKFKRVVQNIIDNAKKNIEPELGQLKIILRETRSSVIIEFKDNGKGISKEALPYIFERFYRADTARENEGSSGLGLAIAKQIVEGLGGRIWALSQVDEGAAIIISLQKSQKGEVTK